MANALILTNTVMSEISQPETINTLPELISAPEVVASKIQVRASGNLCMFATQAGCLWGRVGSQNFDCIQHCLTTVTG